MYLYLSELDTLKNVLKKYTEPIYVLEQDIWEYLECFRSKMSDGKNRHTIFDSQ